MSITHIAPKTRDVYWFIDLGATIISGVTEPGQLTSSKFEVDQNEDEKILVDKLKVTPQKLKDSGAGFRIVDGKVVFLRDPLEPSPTDISNLDAQKAKL